jgi:hypothetical protein
VKPVTLRKVTEFHPNDWLVYQTFNKWGKQVIVRGFGRSRLEALYNFADELEYTETHTDYNPFDTLAGWLYDLAGMIDKLIERTLR